MPQACDRMESQGAQSSRPRNSVAIPRHLTIRPRSRLQVELGSAELGSIELDSIELDSIELGFIKGSTYFSAHLYPSRQVLRSFC